MYKCLLDEMSRTPNPKDTDFFKKYKTMIVKHDIVWAEVSEDLTETVVDILPLGKDNKIMADKKKDWARQLNLPKLKVPQINH